MTIQRPTGLSATTKVRWLKAFDGMSMTVGEDVVAVRPSFETIINDIGRAIGGTDDALAVYIKSKPNPRYYDGVPARESIAGLLWLAPMPAGKSPADYPEDETYCRGWPLAGLYQKQGPRLKDIVARVFPSTFSAEWRAVCGGLTGGKPFRIDSGRFSYLGEELTKFYRSC